MRFDLELRVHGLEGLRVAASITPTLTSGARLNHVPLRGGGQAMNDLVADHLPWMMASARRQQPRARGRHPRARPYRGPAHAL
jgi:tripartite-type tricarboxylate transporter receptor subunit TctC